MWTHFRDTQPRGRRQYRCCLCGLRIRKGAKHILRTGVTEDGFVSSRMHAVCESKTRTWMNWEWECGYDEVEFREFCLELKPCSALVARGTTRIHRC